MDALPVEYAKFQVVMEKAFAEWAPAASVRCEPLKAGHSGAAVLKADISGATGSLEPGQYILKLSDHPEYEDQEVETSAHRRAEETTPAFAEQHIPRLTKEFAPLPAECPGYAMLYEIAGRSLDSYTAIDVPECPGFLEIADRVSEEMLGAWADHDPSEPCKPAKLLESWLGYRLRPEQASKLHEFASSSLAMGVGGVVGGEPIPNALSFYKFASGRNWAARSPLLGLLHGDLHGENLLLHRRPIPPVPYWIIDFGLSRRGAMGFDQAYLEMAHILYCLGDSDPALLVGLLKALDNTHAHQRVPQGTFWLLNALTKMRHGVEKWILSSQPRRVDDLNRQFLLARVAAGINWANKPIKNNQRYHGLVYAGWAARQYLERYESKDEDAFWRSGGRTTAPVKRIATASDQVNDDLWQNVLGVVDGFASSAGRFILVAEGLGDNPAIRALGQLPWSAVIDLDPNSHAAGLHRHATPVLETRRGLHVFSKEVGPVDFVRGTAWMMAAGWALNGEPSTDYTGWKYDKLHLIRDFLAGLDRQTSPEPIFAFFLQGTSLDRDAPHARMEQIAAALEETSRGRAVSYVIGRAPFPAGIKHQHIPIDTAYFIQRLQEMFGTGGVASVPQLPGKEGWCSLHPDSLRAVEENLDVLHSAVLATPVRRETEGNPSGFWRGSPPSWFDIHSGLDIPRKTKGGDLEKALRTWLTEIRTHTVVLHHTPGAGGTTAGLRAAWKLHWEYPTAILRIWSKALPDRIQYLYNRTQKPVLLVCDSSILTESDRESLHRQLRERNIPTVMLYIRRVFQVPAEGFQLTAPMDDEEAGYFCKQYSTMTTDEFRRRELNRISHDNELVRYRSPFFYGLITFEREFRGTANYVLNHIADVRGKRQQILQYLALITIYCNTGLHEILVRRMLGYADTLKLSLAEWIGEGPSNLIRIQNGRMRLMHQVIGEEILRHYQGDNWKLELRTLAIDFIREVADVADPASEVVVDMFRQTFVERQSGGSAEDEDRKDFSPLIEDVDQYGREFGHRILQTLVEKFPYEAHFYNHLGRHQMYCFEHDIAKAEEYLLKAIELSSESDPVHFHTLGVVRRNRLRQAMRSAPNVSSLLETIKPHFEGATWAFEQARLLSRDNPHGYITHIQMILEVAEKLTNMSGVRSVAAVRSVGALWIQEQLPMAEDLLYQVGDLYGTLDQANSYLSKCHTMLENLYDNIDEVIRIWEVAHERGNATPGSRRALVFAYFERANNSWVTLQGAELRRVVSLMELNLRSPGRREEDYRLWFEAYKLLPEFTVEEALSRLKVWVERFPSWRAFYYTYLIHFLLWFSRRTEDTNAFEHARECCQKAAFGRRSKMHNWLAIGQGECPLLATGDLGNWDRKLRFWPDTHALKRVNGVIDKIDGPQAGHILIGGKVKAFFVPVPTKTAGNEENVDVPAEGTLEAFYGNGDEGKAVNFFLGFSPTGLRAWNVKRGVAKGGDRPLSGAIASPMVAPEHPAASEETKLSRLRELQLARVETFIYDIVKTKSELGEGLPLAALQESADAVFGVDGVLGAIGVEDTAAFLQANPQYVVTSDERGTLVRLRAVLKQSAMSPKDPAIRERRIGWVNHFDPMSNYGFIQTADERCYFKRDWVLSMSDRKIISHDLFVEFSHDHNDQGGLAIDIRIVGADELRQIARDDALRIIRNDSTGYVGITMKELSDQLIRKYGDGKLLLAKCGVSSWTILLRGLEGIRIYGEHPEIRVSFADSAFGRLADRPTQTQSTDKASESGRSARRPGVPKAAIAGPTNALESMLLEVQEEARLFVKSAPDEVSRLAATIANHLIIRFKGFSDRPLFKYLGFKNFSAFIKKTPGLRMTGVVPRSFVEFDPGPERRATGSKHPQKNATSGAVTLIDSKTPLPIPQGTPIPTDGPAVSPPPNSSPDIIDREMAIAMIRLSLEEAPDRCMTVAQLGTNLAKKFPGTGRMAVRLGARTLSEFVRTIPGVTLVGQGPEVMAKL